MSDFIQIIKDPSFTFSLGVLCGMLITIAIFSLAYLIGPKE